MDTMWERIRKGLKDGATLSMEKIEEYTKIGKLKIDEMATRRKIDRNFADIGERVYELLKDSKASSVESDIVIKRGVENVNSLKQDLVTIAEKIKQVQEEAKKSRQHAGTDDDESLAGV
jgi:hypothetical protein